MTDQFKETLLGCAAVLFISVLCSLATTGAIALWWTSRMGSAKTTAPPMPLVANPETP